VFFVLTTAHPNGVRVGLLGVLIDHRHPLPVHWPRHRTNFLRVAVTHSSEEWDIVLQRLHDSLPNAEVTQITRYALQCRLYLQGILEMFSRCGVLVTFFVLCFCFFCGCLFRIQNQYLWQQYQHKRVMLACQLGDDAVNERLLWHQTPSDDPYSFCRGVRGFPLVRVRNRRPVLSWVRNDRCVCSNPRVILLSRLCHARHLFELPMRVLVLVCVCVCVCV